MSRAIKVEDQVYQELYTIRTKEQTFSQVIEEILKARSQIFELLYVLEGQLNYREWQRAKFDAMTQARAERADLEARTL